MKSRKVQEKTPQSQRQPPNPKTHTLTKRKSEGNKENLIQITEPLDMNPATYPSKEFILSRENLGSNNKSVLREASLGHNRQFQQYQQPQKSQELFDRRLSLKCTGVHSQQLEFQKSQRLSMMPLRR
jgi:hypothetical protein